MNDIICFEIVEINSTGVTLKHENSNVFVGFAECAKNYAREKSLETSRCIATRDIIRLTFTFYTDPKTKLIIKKHIIKDLFSGKSAVSKFFDLQKIINKYGYTSLDLS